MEFLIVDGTAEIKSPNWKSSEYMSDVHFHFHGVEEEEIVSGYLPDGIRPKGIHALGISIRTQHNSLSEKTN
jgi:hypothetical protein